MCLPLLRLYGPASALLRREAADDNDRLEQAEEVLELVKKETQW